MNQGSTVHIDLERTVACVMQPCPQAIPMSASVQDAAARMSQDDRCWLPVRGPTGPVGVISAGDIVRRAAVRSEPLTEARVSDVMTLGVVCCSASDSVAEALQLISRHGVSHLGVVDEANRLSAVASAHDLIGAALTPEPPEG